MKQKVIFLFLDGVGMGNANAYNPFYAATLPFIESLTKCKLIKGNEIVSENLVLKGIDACLGTPGLPQSATGQTSLFTGINAAKYLGYHYPAFPDEQLKKVIDEHTLLKEANNKGFNVTFANAYTPNYFLLVSEGKRQHSVTTLSVFAAGLNFRNLTDLMNGNAVYWDITNEYLVMNNSDINIKMIPPQTAGKNIANLSKEFDLVIFECFLPDIIGHKRDMERAFNFLLTFDDFLHGIVMNIEPGTIVIVSSDHGNIEDLNFSGHTLNPVLFLAIGNVLNNFKDISSICDLKAKIMQILQSE